jgi:hypothetical protein
LDVIQVLATSQALVLEVSHPSSLRRFWKKIQCLSKLNLVRFKSLLLLQVRLQLLGKSHKVLLHKFRCLWIRWLSHLLSSSLRLSLSPSLTRSLRAGEVPGVQEVQEAQEVQGVQEVQGQVVHRHSSNPP